MRILFVYYNAGSALSFHPAIQILSAIAKEKGHQTKVLHIHEKMDMMQPDNIEGIMVASAAFVPDLIAFTSTDFEFEKITEIARILRKQFIKQPFLLGGKAIINQKNIENLPFDAYCIGEAEIPFMLYLENPKSVYIPSMWFKKDDKIIKNPLGKDAIVTDLDKLPFMDFDIFDTPRILTEKDGYLSVQFTRGCPFACTYCFVTADRKTMFEGNEGYGIDKYLRKHSVDYAMRFLENLMEKYGDHIKTINLDDELPVLHKSWWKEFCQQYKNRIYEKYGIEFICNSRINIMTEDVIKMMSESGCKEVRMGFESGSFRLRSEILHKPITNENMEQVYKWCDKWSLKASSFTMIGIPSEAIYEIYETLGMTARLKPFIVRLSFCYPFEHTPLYDYSVKHDLINWDRYMSTSGYFEESPLKWDSEYEQKLMAFRFLFPWYVNILIPDFPVKLHLMYKDAIDGMLEADFRNPETFKYIREWDAKLSAECGDIEHYAYFPNGFYFYCKNKKYPKLRPIVRKQTQTNEAQIIDACGQRLPWIGDDLGYFLIRGDPKTGLLEVAHCKNDALGQADYIIRGKEPAEIYDAVSKLGLISRTEHASYLGKELTKLHISMRLGTKYVQDDPIDDITKSDNIITKSDNT